MNVETQLAGWRPTCLLCRKPVDYMNIRRMEYMRSTEIVVECHGRGEIQIVRDEECYTRRVPGGIRQIIEIRGCFRQEAEARRKESERALESRFRSPQQWIDAFDYQSAEPPDVVEFTDNEGRVVGKAVIPEPRFNGAEFDASREAGYTSMMRQQEEIFRRRTEEQIRRDMLDAWRAAERYLATPTLPKPPEKPKPKPVMTISVTHKRNIQLE